LARSAEGLAHPAVRTDRLSITIDRMSKLTDLKFLFIVVVVVEAFYAIAAMMPPSLVEPLTGWVLSADGHWVVKLLGMALASQAAVAWIFRKEPHLGVAKALAFYQFASATADWVMWLVLRGEVFSNVQAQIGVVLAIVSHCAIGILLVAGVRKAAVR
jgi:hypothetical protein